MFKRNTEYFVSEREDYSYNFNIYPLVYVISDLITAVSNRKTAIIIIIFGIMCDGFFSYGVYYVSLTNQLKIVQLNFRIRITHSKLTLCYNFGKAIRQYIGRFYTTAKYSKNNF